MRRRFGVAALMLLLPIVGCKSSVTPPSGELDVDEDAPAPAAASAPLTCSIDKHGAARQDLTVQTLNGAEDAEWQFMTFQGHKAAVRFNAGDQFEGQRLLWLRLDDRSFKVYDPTKTLYKLHASDGVTIQCYDGTAAPASKQDGSTLGCSIAKAGQNRTDVPPALVAGAEVANPTIIPYGSHKSSATFNAGDEFDSQQLLMLSMGRYGAQVYDPGHSLTVLAAADGTEMQCHFGDGTTSGSVLD